MKDNLLVYAYKLSKASDGEQYHGEIIRFENTKDLFVSWKNILVNKYETFKELTCEVMEGKIAVFPVWEKQDTINIEGHLNYGFDVILLKYREYNNFVEYYKENAVEINKENVLKELKQKELF